MDVRVTTSLSGYQILSSQIFEKQPLQDGEFVVRMPMTYIKDDGSGEQVFTSSEFIEVRVQVTDIVTLRELLARIEELENAQG